MEQEEVVTGALLRKQRFYKAATTIAHICGLVLKGKRYIGRSPVVQWATFYLQRQIHLRSDLLFNKSDYSKKHSNPRRYQGLLGKRNNSDIWNLVPILASPVAMIHKLELLNKSFEKLTRLLHICPRQRRQQDILQIQACLKTNRAFRCLPSKTQFQLCQIIVYQKYEAGTVIIQQGHIATECYLVLSGKLEFTMADENIKDKISISETLGEAEGGDFIGEACLLTNTRRLSSVICKSDAELVVISKEDFNCILANIRYEQHHGMCQFLRKHLLFSTWPPGKIDFLIQCSLQRFYRAGTVVVTNSLNSYFLVIVQTGRCMEATKLDSEAAGTQNAAWKMTPNYKSVKQKPQTPAAMYCSSGKRKDLSDLEEKGSKNSLSFSPLVSSRKGDNRIKRTYNKRKTMEVTPQFLKIRTLEQSDIFGLADIMDKGCDLQLSLISEGAQCILIPKRIFLQTAPAKSRQIALEMLGSYPTKTTIQESYNMQQAWSTYKTKLIGLHLEKHARPDLASISS